MTPEFRTPEIRMETLERAYWRLNMRVARLETLMAVTQADLDALSTKLGDLKNALAADDAALQQEIAALQAANPNLDLSGVQAAVDQLSAQVDATAALVLPAA